ncbi:MAG: DUF948 domain-containing protein [Geobacteraceae bacterium]|nr:DUF948 domain-containing protein [Geobacteraceae bacterium]
MVVISIAVSVVAITFVVLAFFAIPAFIEARRTAVAAREFLSRTDMELQPALKDLRLLIDDLKLMAADAAEKTGEVQLFMEALGDTGRNLRIINSVVGAVAGALSTSSLWLTGAKVAGKFIMDRVTKKGGK